MQNSLSPNQKHVVADLYRWCLSGQKGHVTLGGYAGTGKTTTITILRSLLKKAKPKLRVAFASYTGKASQVLMTKLLESTSLYPEDFVGTIHSLMYYPKLDKSGKIISWSKSKKIEYDLLIIDEASMVTKDIWFDLESYGIPIVAVGDHGQLPPIGDSFNLLEKPDLVLTEIHRQAKSSPIIEIANIARISGEIPDIDYSHKVRKISNQHPDASEILESTVLGDNDYLLLCAKNTTRIKLNTHIRNLKGYESVEPIVGDRLICLKNNYENADGPIFNGMIGQLKKIFPKGDHWFEAQIDFDLESKKYEGVMSKHQFNQPTMLSQVEGVKPKEIGDRFDFGYALTVHKAQGSQAKKVILFEENASAYMSDSYSRWLYTAITRAIDELYIFY